MSLTVPSDFPVGIIIGKNGTNIENIRKQSGANVHFDTSKMTVAFKGTPVQVETARTMIEQQINDWRNQVNDRERRLSQTNDWRERRPSQTNERRPSQTSERRPSQTNERRPSLASERRPSQTNERRPSQTNERRPSQANDWRERRPSQTNERRPERRPSQTNEKRPSQYPYYPYSRFIAIVLSPGFEDTVTNSQKIRFKAVHMPKDTSHDHKEQMYRLDLNTLTGDEDDEDELATAFERSLTFDDSATPSIYGKGKKTIFAQNRDWSHVMSQYQNAAKNAVDFNDPAFNRLKFRVNFGMQLFYTTNEATCHVPQSDLKLSDVLGMVVGQGRDLKACYSNEVSLITIIRIRKFLSELGFTLSLENDVVIGYGKDTTKIRGFDFKFDLGIDERGRRQIQHIEIRPNKARIATVSFIHPTVIKNTTKNPDQGLDFRIRCMGDFPISEEERTELMSLAEGSTWSEVTKEIKSDHLEFEMTRYKKKELFTGKFHNIQVEVGLINVTDDAGSHWEMEVISLDYDANPTDRDLFDKLMVFCDELRAKAIEQF